MRFCGSGFLAVPHLWEERAEFAAAVGWRTALMDGAMEVVDDTGAVLDLDERLAAGVVRAQEFTTWGRSR